ncbi:MAG: DUF4333 domain-containing protein [Pseudonocardia sp.]
MGSVPAGRPLRPAPPLPRPAPRRTAPVLPAVALAAVVVAAGVVCFGAPGYLVTRVLDQAALAQGVARILVEEYAVDVTSVSCPAGIRAEPGATFTCTAVVAGQQADVPVTVTSRFGAYSVGRPA